MHSPSPSPRALAVALAVTVAHCSGAQTPEEPARPRTARDYLPLRRGAAWSFDAQDMERGGPSTLLAMRVVRENPPNDFFVQTGNRGAPALYAYEANGVSRNGETVLRDPIAEGTRWRGRLGDNYVIARTGLTRTVPAGTFRGVIQVLRTGTAEAPGNGMPITYTETYWYAPGVGPIEGEVPIMPAGGEARRFRLTLRGYTLDGEL